MILSQRVVRLKLVPPKSAYNISWYKVGAVLIFIIMEYELIELLNAC